MFPQYDVASLVLLILCCQRVVQAVANITLRRQVIPCLPGRGFHPVKCSRNTDGQAVWIGGSRCLLHHGPGYSNLPCLFSHQRQVQVLFFVSSRKIDTNEERDPSYKLMLWDLQSATATRLPWVQPNAKPHHDMSCTRDTLHVLMGRPVNVSQLNRLCRRGIYHAKRGPVSAANLSLSTDYWLDYVAELGIASAHEQWVWRAEDHLPCVLHSTVREIHHLNGVFWDEAGGGAAHHVLLPVGLLPGRPAVWRRAVGHRRELAGGAGRRPAVAVPGVPHADGLVRARAPRSAPGRQRLHRVRERPGRRRQLPCPLQRGAMRPRVRLVRRVSRVHRAGGRAPAVLPRPVGGAAAGGPDWGQGGADRGRPHRHRAGVLRPGRAPGQRQRGTLRRVVRVRAAASAGRASAGAAAGGGGEPAPHRAGSAGCPPPAGGGGRRPPAPRLRLPACRRAPHVRCPGPRQRGLRGAHRAGGLRGVRAGRGEAGVRGAGPGARGLVGAGPAGRALQGVRPGAAGRAVVGQRIGPRGRGRGRLCRMLVLGVRQRSGEFRGCFRGQFFFSVKKPGLGLVALCLQSPSVALQPPSVTLHPPSVTLLPLSVAPQPPLGTH